MPATAVLAPTATRTCTNAACIHAATHVSLCECTDCLGDNHGSAHRTGRNEMIARQHARYVVPGFDRNMLAAVGDDEAF